MNDFQDVAPIARKTMVLFFLLDTSGSMEGKKISALNDGIEETIPLIKDISNNNIDAEIRFAVLSFASGTEWITPEPVDLNKYKFKGLNAGGCTDLGEAFTELESKLHKETFLSSVVGNLAPVMILMSDGEPTDDYRKGLDLLKQNKWFKKGIKVAFAIGDDANKDILAEFTGNKETVLKIDNKQQLKNMIREISVSVSTIGSEMKKNSDEKIDEAVDKIVKIKEMAEQTAADSEADVSGGW